MFDDVKKGEKLKKKQPIKSKTTNYEKLMNELENLKNNIKSKILTTMQMSNFLNYFFTYPLICFKNLNNL